MMDETTTASRVTRDGKYELITYLLEQKKTLDEIIALTKDEAPDLFPPDRSDLMDALERYVVRNHNKIKRSNLFFPGQKGQTSSKSTITFQLYHYLAEQGRSLSEFGLRIMKKDEDVINHPESTKQNTLDRVKSLLK